MPEPTITVNMIVSTTRHLMGTTLDDHDLDSSVPSESDSKDICPTPLESPSDEPLNKHTHGENIVQFYDTPEYILNVLTNFIVPILSTKDAAVIVAVKDRLEAVEMRLRNRGVAVDAKDNSH